MGLLVTSDYVYGAEGGEDMPSAWWDRSLLSPARCSAFLHQHQVCRMVSGENIAFILFSVFLFMGSGFM